MVKPKTQPTVELDENELSKQIINSVLRDFFAGVVAAGMHAGLPDGFPDEKNIAEHAYLQADCLLSHSQTPKLVQKLKKV